MNLILRIQKKSLFLVSLIPFQKVKTFKKFNAAWTCFAIFGKIGKIILTNFLSTRGTFNTFLYD